VIIGAPADFAVLEEHPLSAVSRVVETWIDGQLAWSGAG
jgi:predicted amidohydrolase YtcJ